MQVAPLGDVTANLTLDDIPLVQVFGLTPGLREGAGGSLDGSATWRSPAKTLLDTATWEGQATLTGDELRVAGIALDRVNAAARLAKGELKLTDLKFGVQGLMVAGTGTMTLKDSYPYEVRFGLDDADLGALTKLTPGVTLPVTVDGRMNADAVVRGKLTPMTAEASGTVDARRLRLGDFTFESVRSGWKIDPKRVLLEDVTASLYQGRVTGSATLPLDPKETGTVNFALKSLNVGAMTKDVKGLPVRLSGEASGTVEGKLAPAAAGGEREFSAELNLDAPKLRVQNVPTERLRGRFGYTQGAIRYRLEGDALGGKFELEGRVPVGAAPKPPPGAEGSIRLRGVRIGGLTQALGQLELPGPLRGLLDLELDYSTDADGEYQGRGRVNVSRLRWDRTDLATRLVSDIVIRNSVLELRETSAEVLGGSLRLRAAVNLRFPERSFLSVVAERMELNRLGAIFPELGLDGEGPMNLRLWTTLGREWRGGGQLELTRGKISGVDVGGWQIPYRFTWSPEWNRGELTVFDSGAQLAMGRANGRATVIWGSGVSVEVHVRFQNLEVRSLLRTFGEVGQQFGAGRASGLLDLTGRDVRSLNDLSGRLEIDFRQAQALQLPVLSRITPFLRGVSQATSFEKGDLRATLGRGIWRVQRLTAESRTLNLMAEGIVTVQGRLDLEVTVRTGELFVNPVLLRLLGLSVGQPAPVEVLIRASEWLSNRVIHLRVGGTVGNPVVRVEPVRLLTEEAIRFFIRGTLPNAPGSRPGG
jgi:hypothetical protein